MKTRFILNPAAGGGKGQELLRRLPAKLQEHGLTADWVLSRHPEESLSLADRATDEGVELLVACGGDGTIHSLLPALVHRPLILGLIPMGTANDLARCWGIPRHLDEALRLLRRGQPRAIDVIATQGNYIAGAGGIGFDALVVARADRLRKRWKGIFPFLAAAALEFSRYRPPTLTLDAGEWHFRGPAWQLLFTKIPRYALFLKIASPIPLADGKMQLCLVPGLAKLHLLARSPLFLFAGCKSLPGVRFFSASRIAVESTPPLLIHGDGEIIGRTPAVFEVLPRAIRVMMPSPDLPE